MVAQTNIQLYNQLRRQGRSREEMVLVHRAYELATTLYPGFYQGDGKPFVAHPIGVASILADLDQPAEILAMALIHAVYGNADFGDGPPGVTPARRTLVREAVGESVEDLVHRFTEQRLSPDTIDHVRRAVPGMDDTDRRLQVVALADHLEKYVDLGVLYFGDQDQVAGWTRRIGGEMVELAGELGEPRLGQMLADAFAEAESHAGAVPAELRPSDGRIELTLVAPRSCRCGLPGWDAEPLEHGGRMGETGDARLELR